MIMKFETHLLLCVIYQCASSQFTSRRIPKTPCEIRSTALVEQFFNAIFAEFHHSPPVCTCVQMCPNRPTYCYPNGCFKKAEKKKETSPVSSIQNDAKTTFLVNSDSQVFADLIGNEELMGSFIAGKSEKSHQQPSETHLSSRSNPLKEMVFKYKRMPKLQMKYNLREQVKNTRDKKADVDVSKTRWPINKQINRQANHPRTSNYLTSILFPETSQAETPNYFKRYLTKRENQMGLDISALYLYKDVSNFSLDTLIDNLIEKGLEGGNSTLELKITNLSKLKDEDNIENTNLDNSIINDLHNDTNEKPMKISIVANSTDNNNTHQSNNNSYNENSTTETYFEMITALSEQIEKQNNKSMEAMGLLSGHRIISESLNNLNSTTINKAESSLKSTNKLSEGTVNPTTNIVPTSVLKVFSPAIKIQNKKGKQRIVRKLRNSKLN